MSQWTQKKLKAYILNAVQGKNTLVVDGKPTEATKEIIGGFAGGMAQTMQTWQREVRINNVLVNGGTTGAPGPVNAAQGIMLLGAFSKKIKAKDVLSNTQTFFPSNYIMEVTGGLKASIDAVASTFAEIFNFWLDLLVITGIEVNGGTATGFFAPATVPGTVVMAIGTLPSLDSGVAFKIPKLLFNQILLNTLGPDLRVNIDGEVTDPMKDMVAAMGEGIMAMYDEWLLSTEIKNLLVNGGTAIPAGVVVGSVGIVGELV